MKTPSLDDLRVFLAVACEGSLNAAATALSASPATLSRRVNLLEEQTGITLFDRSPTGYKLTADGESLRERVLVLDAVRAELEDWLEQPKSGTSVKISAGTWTAKFLIDHIDQLHKPDDDFKLLFVTTEQQLNIAHREIDIGLRSAQPSDQNLVASRIAEVRYCRYVANSVSLDESGSESWPWVMLSPECAITQSARWMLEHHLTHVAVQCTSSHTLLDLVLVGAGVTVLPCFIGDRIETLKRVGPIIDELSGEQWLVMHGETRNRPAVRTVLERVRAVVEANSSLYRGEVE